MRGQLTPRLLMPISTAWVLWLSLLVCGQNWWSGIPSFCQQFMVRIITAMQGTQEKLQLLWTWKVEGVGPWLGIGVCVGGGGRFPTSRSYLEVWSVLCLVCLGIVLTCWWQAECPWGVWVNSQGLQTPSHAAEGSRSRLKNVVEDSRKLPSLANPALLLTAPL